MRSRGHLLDAAARRSGDGLVLVGGVPPRMVRLTPRGRDALERVLRGETVTEPAVLALVERLLDAELIHPIGSPATTTSITTVIPVYNGAPRLAALVGTLARTGKVIVVDDGSVDGSAEIAAAAGAEVVANRYQRGPAGARNTGLDLADTDLVAFVDDDCTVDEHWAEHLVGLLEEDERLALAAPRVRSKAGTSPLARYEMSASPLDLGPHPAIVGPQRRLTFVPSAALVVRRAAALEVGGFDPQLQVGEDVDLVWRLVAAGWRVRYAPASEVRHDPRTTLRAFAKQRFAYGTSAALLQRRHPGAASPLHIVPATGVMWGVAAALGPVPGAATLFASAIAAALRTPASRGHVATLVARGHVQATRQLARIAAREWLPATALAGVRSSRFRRVILGALAVDALAERVNPALRLVDNAAYAAGLWRGAIRERSAAALLLGRAGSPTRRRRGRRPEPDPGADRLVDVDTDQRMAARI